MEINEIADNILRMNEQLSKMQAEIKSRAERKAKSIADYDRQLAITMIKLRNGSLTVFENNRIDNPGVTMIEKLAKGMCWKERLEMEEADAEYKSLITNIETTKAQLNGLQSINKHLEYAG